MPRPYDFSSITALIAFEAAARHGNFKSAADEINVTASAISHQVKALEQDLGRQLFVRRHRGVELTDHGLMLVGALQRGFTTISEAVGHARALPAAVDVTISATTAVSALWLTPRITAFWRAHPDVSVSQLVSDVPGWLRQTDLGITYGDPRETAGGRGGAEPETREIFTDRILALGAPGFAAEHAITSAEQLGRAPLVHLGGEAAGWTTWDDWFSALDLPAASGRKFNVNNYMIALQAAQDGVGAVLGWERLVEGFLSTGRLVRLLDAHVPAPVAFYLQIHRNASAQARAFADWLVRPA